MIDIYSFLLICIFLMIGSYTDLKVREVPDYISYSLIILGFGIGLIKSVLIISIYPIIFTGLGFGLAFIISLIMFYTGQWGGGDAKILMGIGSIIGITLPIRLPEFFITDFFISFLFNTIIIGAIYGLIWGLILGIINIKKLKNEIYKTLEMKSNRILRKVIIIICSILIIITFTYSKFAIIRTHLLIIIFAIFSLPYLWVYIKSVEKICMIKNIIPKDLTEGDWIIEDIVINKKLIASKKDLGVSIEQIEKLKGLYDQGKVKLITIKTGIPFIPSFLIGFILTYFFNNLFISLLK